MSEISEWKPIATAPTDGSAIQARIPGHGDDNVIAWLEQYVDANGEDVGGWNFVTEQEPPECWTDGICWASNEDGVPSIQPTHWKELT